MALPMLQVGAVLTNLVCTKVPILARPHCYRDNADRYPHKFKCCPYNYVFVNYDRICSCVPKKYGKIPDFKHFSLFIFVSFLKKISFVCSLPIDSISLKCFAMHPLSLSLSHSLKKTDIYM